MHDIRKCHTALVLSALLGALGCNTPAEEPTHALGQANQGLLTTTYTLSWPSNTATTGDLCRFGDTSQGHQVATNARASGRLEESLTLSGLGGRRITSIRLNGAATTFKYDDVMLLTYNNHLVMSSDRRVAEYSALSTSLGTSPVQYVWSNILNKLIDNQNIQPTWCTSGATTCTVPRTETLGSMDVNIPNFSAVDQAAYPSSPETRTFRLVTIGDNDPTIDCRHGPITLTVTVQHVPASCTPTTEVCDGVDNDCDDLIDEMPAPGQDQFSGWTAHAGSWRQDTSATLYQDSTSTNLVYEFYRTPSNLYQSHLAGGRDYDVEADMAVSSGPVGWNAVGIAFRIQNTGSFYRVHFFPGYPGGALRFEKFVNGQAVLVQPDANIGWTPAYGEVHKLRLSTRGSTFTATIRNLSTGATFSRTFTDSSFVSGGVGLANPLGPGFFRNWSFVCR